MSTCQIEVVEFGQTMARPWVQTENAAPKPQNLCVCYCTCPCYDSVSDATNDKYEARS
jgi:hypothetical protein